jgi:hypothetical protein
MAKCYVIVCPACDRMDIVQRPALTCSTACRVRLHRHPELHPDPSVALRAPGLSPEARAKLVSMARMLDGIPPTFGVQLLAYIRLFPDDVAAITAGTLSLEHPKRKDVISDEAREKAVEALLDRARAVLAAEPAA